MRVGTPLGEFPFEFRRVERRGDSVAIVGIVAGLESGVILDHDDLKTFGLFVVGPALGVVALAAYACCRRD